jgi:hypothetical protein
VPIELTIALRFSRPMRPETVTSQTILLSGPRGLVIARPGGRGGGRAAGVPPAGRRARGGRGLHRCAQRSRRPDRASPPICRGSLPHGVAPRRRHRGCWTGRQTAGRRRRGRDGLGGEARWCPFGGRGARRR